LCDGQVYFDLCRVYNGRIKKIITKGGRKRKQKRYARGSLVTWELQMQQIEMLTKLQIFSQAE